MANTYKALQTVTVGSGGAASINFTNIPPTYTDLVIKVTARNNASAIIRNVNLRVNNNSTAIYSERLLDGNGSSAGSASASGTILNWGGLANDTNSTASTFSNYEIYIPNYASNNPKSISIDAVAENNDTFGQQRFAALLANTTEPITSVNIIGEATLLQNSTATLYGVFNADVSSASATPTIGTAFVATATSASISFTPVSNAASYTVTSTPGSITASGTTSPIVVSGLTTNTSYTFKVKSNNPFGSSAESAASNSVTPTSLSYESIATVTVGSGGSTTVTFSGIPSAFAHLQIRGVYDADIQSDQFIQFNSDTGANYSWHSLYGQGSTTTAINSTNATYSYFGYVANVTAVNGAVIDILDYKDTNKFKTVRYVSGYDNNGSGFMFFGSGNWRSTTAISTITLSAFGTAKFVEGSTFALYGIRSA